MRCNLTAVSFHRATGIRVDIRGSTLSGSFGLEDVNGFRLGTDQLLVPTTALLVKAGGTLDDDTIPDLSDPANRSEDVG